MTVSYAELSALHEEWRVLRRAAREAEGKPDGPAAAAAAAEARGELHTALEHGVTTITPDFPVLLLPVRVETKYDLADPAKPRLLVKIYPDDIHLNGHESALTAREVELGETYWRDTFAAVDELERRNAWSELVLTTATPQRAAWIASRLTPTNSPLDGAPAFPVLGAGDTQGQRWEQGTRAQLLPDAWRVHLYQGGRLATSSTGTLIPRNLPVPPLPQYDDTLDEDQDPTRWVQDFAAAEEVGMAVAVPLRTPAPPHETDDPAYLAALVIDQLIVLGVRGSATASDDATDLGKLLTAHSYDVGLDLVPPGTPTNNSTANRSGLPEISPAGFELFRDPFRPPALPPAPGGDAELLARALGIDRTGLAGLPHEGQRDVASEASMLRALRALPAYYLNQLLPLESFHLGNRTWSWVARNVRPGGPLPALRRGKQPYGILPATSLNLWREPTVGTNPALACTELVTDDTGAVTARLRILADAVDGRWRYEVPALVRRVPADAYQVATAVDTTVPPPAPGQAPVLVAAFAAESAPGGVMVARLRLEASGPRVDPFDLGAAAGALPADALAGLAITTGHLTGEPAGTPPSIMVIAQPAPYQVGGTVALVGTPSRAPDREGALDWRVVDPPRNPQALRRGQLMSASLVEQPGVAANDLVLVTADDDAADSPACLWTVLRNIQNDFSSSATEGPFEVGRPIGQHQPPTSASLTFTNLGGDPTAVLATYRTEDDGALYTEYQHGPLDEGQPHMPPPDQDWTSPRDLGAVLTGRATVFKDAAATWLTNVPHQDPRPGLNTSRQSVNLLRRLRDRFGAAVDNVPAMTEDSDAGQKWYESILSVLSTDAVSQTADTRRFVGPDLLYTHRVALGEDPPTDITETTVRDAIAPFGLNPDPDPDLRTPLARGAFEAVALKVSEPWSLTPGETPGQGATWVKEMLNATPQELHDQWQGEGTTFIQAVIRQAVLSAWGDAALAVGWSSQFGPLPEPELIDVVNIADPDPSAGRTLTTWRHLIEWRMPNGELVTDYLLREVRKSPPNPHLVALRDVLDALHELRGTPEEELGRLVGSILDLYSHRVDAWATAVATARLEAIRDRPQTATGIRIGAWGYVCDLKPRSNEDRSTGYWLAPSRTQAVASTLLRDAFTSHPQAAAHSLDLTAGPVHAAQRLAHDVDETSSLGHALGSWFEDELTRRDLLRYLPAFRQLAPLQVGALTPLPDNTPVTQATGIAHLNGTVLLDLHAAGRIPWGATPPGSPGPDLPDSGDDDHTQLEDVFARMRQAGVADQHLGRADASLNLVTRNPDSAGSALDSVNRGTVPPPRDPFVLRTPRAGKGVDHRILVAAPDPRAPVAADALALWTNTPTERRLNLRAAAEPRLNAWAAIAFGDPAKVGVMVRRVNEAGEPVGPPKEYRLNAFGLCPWDVLAAGAAGGADLAQTNLGRRLLQHAQRADFPAADDTRLELYNPRRAEWPASWVSSGAQVVVPLASLLMVARTAAELVRHGRAATGDDFAAGENPPPPTAVGELRTRADAAVAALRTAEAGLRDQFKLEPGAHDELVVTYPALAGQPAITNLLDLPPALPIADVATLARRGRSVAMMTNQVSRRLTDLTGFGIPDCAPRPRSTDRASDLADVVTQARVVSLEARKRLEAANQARTDTDWAAALEAVFGDGFRALPLLNTTRANQANPAGLLSDPVAVDEVDEWFDGVADVMTGAAMLRDVSMATSALTDAEESWQVLQLPFSAPRRWSALPAIEGAANRFADTIQFGSASVVAATFDPQWWGRGKRVAAVHVESFTETVPDERVNVSVPMHFETPNATPPQTALIAVPPDPDVAWSWGSLLAVVEETMDLARIRMVDLDKVAGLGHLLPAVLLPHNAGIDGSYDHDPAGDTIATRPKGT